VIDENAFGVLVAHYDLESVEYSLSESAFIEYLVRFANLVEQCLAAQPLGRDLRRIELGHAFYLEFADGDQQTDPIAWLRGMRQALIDADLPNVCALTAGGRWVQVSSEDAASDGDLSSGADMTQARESGAWRVSSPSNTDDSNAQASRLPLVDPRSHDERERAYGPSEALRKALGAEAFAQPTLSEGNESGWGPGLYIEKDAIEQLGKNLRNTPTALPALSATFYRIGA
jgi:hypothetical protein